ncbi:MAG: DUF308 domain-containing protein [Candidatus Rokubacteria bacterium]|nr:DUF308 domain-containing protein [Candidatus Rokubacteria bacterium]
MKSALVSNWWMLAVRGVLAVLFALAALVWARVTLGEFVLLFGSYLLLDGLLAVASALRSAERFSQAWPLLLEGAVSVVLGVLAWVSPHISWAVLFLIASWGIITGVLEIVAAVGLRPDLTSQWLLALSGVSSLVLGMLLLALPGAGSVWVVRIVGVYALTFGVLLVAAAFRLRGGRGPGAARCPTRPGGLRRRA